MIRVGRIVLLPPDIQGLRSAADAEGVRNMALLIDNWAVERFDGPGEALFAAYDGETLVGVGGVTRETGIPGHAHAAPLCAARRAKARRGPSARRGDDRERLREREPSHLQRPGDAFGRAVLGQDGVRTRRCGALDA